MARQNNVIQVVINGVNRTGPAFKSVAANAAKMGLAVTAALTAATWQAAKFEKGMAEISTLLDGDVDKSIEQMRSSLLDLSVQFGQTLGTLTKANYDIVSAGFSDAAQAADVLTASNKLAVAGVSDVAVAADLVTSALNGLELQAYEAGRVTDVLFQIVRKGKTTLPELGQGLGKIFGTAKQAGVSLEELGAVMAAATAKGVKTTDAITGLNALMLAVAAPTKEAADALKDAGISMEKGFIPALIQLGQASGGSLDKLRKLIPSVEALRVAAAAGGDIEFLRQKLLEMGVSAGVVDEGFAIMAETLDFKMAQAKASFAALGVEIGTIFLPMIKTAVDKMTELTTLFRFMFTESVVGKEGLSRFARVLRDEVIGILRDLNIVLGRMIADLPDPGAGTLGTLAGTLNVLSFAAQDAADSMAGLDFFKTAGFTRSDMNILTLGFTGAAAGLHVLSNKAKGATRDNEKLRKGLVDFDSALDGFSEKWAVVTNKAGEAGAAYKKFLKDLRLEMYRTTKVMVDGNVAIQQALAGGVFIGPIPKPGEGREDQAEPPISKEMVNENARRALEIKMQLDDLTQWAIEDFANMAMSVSSNVGFMLGTVANQMMGLMDGPIMLGRMFKQMAASIVADLAMIVARMLVLRAIMSLFMPGFGAIGAGGGTMLPVGTSLSYAHGGTVRNAAMGMAMPSSLGSVILPGSTGIDSSPVMAQRGELFINRAQVNQAEKSLRRSQTGPRRPAARSGRSKVKVELKANRAFRREEQNLLTDSVTEAIQKAGRYAV